MRRCTGWIFAGGVGVALLAFTLFLGKDAAIRSLEAARGSGPVAIAAVFVVATVILIPFWALAIGTGFLLGGLRGILVAFVGNILGATLSYWAARTLARGPVERLMARRPDLGKVGKAVAGRGFRIVLLTRLSPFIPSNILNYIFGACGVASRSFIPATLLGMVPTLLLYVHAGTTLNRLSDVGTVPMSAGEKIFLVAGVVVTAGATFYVVRMIRRALGKG